MEILLTRHGSIFNATDRVRITGRGLDLPLTETGGKQAEALARQLMAQSVFPAAVLCSPQRRTVRYAEIIMERIGIPGTPMIDARLDDIDYGEMTGLSESQVILQYGRDFYDGWVHQGRWPQPNPWTSDEMTIRTSIESFSRAMCRFFNHDDVVVVVASNALLKFFLTLVPAAFEEYALNSKCSMRTGNIGKITFDGNRFTLDYWNMPPLEVTRLCSSHNSWNYNNPIIGHHTPDNLPYE